MTRYMAKPALLVAATLSVLSLVPATARAQASLLNAPRDFVSGGNPFSVAVSDLNGDGKPDLAVANYGSNNLSALLGNGDGTFQAAQVVSVGLQPRSVAVGDLNGDLRLDLVAANS